MSLHHTFWKGKKKNRQSVSEPSDETRRAALRGHRGRSGVAGSPFNACFRASWHVGGRKETLGSSGPCIRRKPPCLFLISSKLCCHAAIVFSRGHGTHLKHRGPDSPRTPSVRRYAKMLRDCRKRTAPRSGSNTRPPPAPHSRPPVPMWERSSFKMASYVYRYMKMLGLQKYS